MTDLVEQLARLGESERREAARQSGSVRRCRMHTAFREIRKTLLSAFSDRRAAHTIANVARRDHADVDPALCIEIKRQLRERLGHFDDVPGADRIRQIISG